MLTELPEELLVLIFEYSDPVSVVQVSRTCKLLHRVARDTLLWRALFKRYLNRDVEFVVDVGDCDGEAIISMAGEHCSAMRKLWYYGRIRSGGKRPGLYGLEKREPHFALDTEGFHNLVLTSRLGTVTTGCLTDDSRLVLAAGMLHTYDLAAIDAPSHHIKAHFSDVHSLVALSGPVVVSAGGDGRVLLTDAASGRVGWATHCSDDWLRRVAPFGDGSRLAASSRAKELFLLDAGTGALLESVSDLHTSAWSLVSGLGGVGEPVFASGHMDGGVCVWDARVGLGAGAVLTARPHTDIVADMALCAEHTLVTGSYDSDVHCLDLRADASASASNTMHTSPVLQLQSLSRSRVVSGAADGELGVWNWSTSRVEAQVVRESLRLDSAPSEIDTSARSAVSNAMRRFPLAFKAVEDARVVVLNSAVSTALIVASLETGLPLYSIDGGGAGDVVTPTIPIVDNETIVGVGRFTTLYDVRGLATRALLTRT